jgi:hypothetical protein
MELKSILQLLFFLLLDRRYFAVSLGTADHFRRETMLTCPSGSDLCIYLAAAGCVNLTAGDTCCIDGSGNSAHSFSSPESVADIVLQEYAQGGWCAALVLLQVDAVKL